MKDKKMRNYNTFKYLGSIRKDNGKVKENENNNSMRI